MALNQDLIRVATEQIKQGLDGKMKRMESLREHYDLYNNKVVEVDSDVFNIPFPFLANHIDQYLSNIDDPPTLTFKIPNKPSLSDKVQAAWQQEMSSSRSGWKRKDRAEKKMALLCGRGISKIYADSVDNKYQSHYDLVDPYSFIADPTRGRLEDGNYNGETNIFKTTASLKRGAADGFYDKEAVGQLLNRKDTMLDGDHEVVQKKFDRIKALGVDVERASFAGQTGVNMTEWIMRFEGVWHYLFFDPSSGIAVRTKPLKEVFKSGKTPFTSWATHYDEYAFWTKATADDVFPLAEGMRFLLNNALENEKRRTRPMRLVDSGSLVDINELQEYIPDNVVLRNPGKDPNIVTLETPDARLTIDVVKYMDSLTQTKTGLRDKSIEEKDAKVGVYFGTLQEEADRIGIINKEYSESYADKGYNFFWGLRQHLTKDKQVEMLGKRGMKLQMLSRFDLADVDDVDDVIVSGGSRDKELDAIQSERQLNVIKELTAAYPDKMNPHWVIKSSLRKADYDEDDVQEALDSEMTLNRELMEEADQAIQDILLGKQPDLNHGADQNFLQRIFDFVRDEVNYIKLDKQGNQIGIDQKQKDLSDRLMAYFTAHESIVLQNVQRKARRLVNQQLEVQLLQPPQGAQQPVGIQPPGKQELRQGVTQPFESPAGTPAGTASASQIISQRLA